MNKPLAVVLVVVMLVLNGGSQWQDLPLLAHTVAFPSGTSPGCPNSSGQALLREEALRIP